MVKIEDNVITITRGDTLDTNVSIKTKGGEDFVPAEGDVIRFALKKTFKPTEEPIIFKVIPNETLHLRLEAEDTKLLLARDEPYAYDVQITMANGTVDTFIDRGKFFVTDEVD